MTDFKVGDRAGIGCFVRACRECRQCQKGTDQYCSKMVRLQAHHMLHNMRVPACIESAELGEYANILVGLFLLPVSTKCSHMDFRQNRLTGKPDSTNASGRRKTSEPRVVKYQNGCVTQCSPMDVPLCNGRLKLTSGHGRKHRDLHGKPFRKGT